MAGVCAGLFAAVSGMLRPDGVLFAAPLALAFWGRRRRGLAPYLLVCVTLLAAFHGWRWHYYGSLIPNTYYAKSAFLELVVARRYLPGILFVETWRAFDCRRHSQPRRIQARLAIDQ